MRMTPGEDEATAKRQAPARPSVSAAVRPGDGVRALVPLPPGSSPDILIPPRPLASSRGLVASSAASAPPQGPPPPLPDGRSSYADMRPPMGSLADVGPPPPSHPSHPAQAQPQAPPPSAALTQREKYMIVVGAPVIVGLAIGFVLMAGGRNGANPSIAPAPGRSAAPGKSAGKAPEAPALVAAVVIAPPEPVEETTDAGARPKRPIVRAEEDPVALLLQEGGPTRARRVLEERGVDKLTVDELRVLRAICKSQKDAACVSRVTVVMDRR